MALKVDKRCKVCQRCLADPAFMKRLFASRAYVPNGEPLVKISADTGANYKALIRHTKKHQGISEYELTVQKRKVQARQASGQLVRGALKAETARQTVLDQLAQILEDAGALELGKDITAKDAIGLLLKATKDSDDVQAKKKDQDIDVFKLMTQSRSGATPLPAGNDDEPFDPWATAAPDAEEAELVDDEVE